MKRHLARKHLAITAVACLLIGGLCGFLTNLAQSDEDLNLQWQKLGIALQYVVQQHVDTIKTSKLVENTIRGMLESLNDPYSEYLPPRERNNFEENFRGNFQGIGIRFGIRDSMITVLTPILDGPSDKVGLKFGDRIIKINGINAIGMPQDSVPLKLKGPAGTQVTVTVKREGWTEPRDFTITREVVPTTSVEAQYMLDSETGYIFVNRFAATTTEDVVKAAQNLKKQGMKKLLLDLRNNPGGYLDQAWRLADEFIKQGQRLVYTKDRYGNIREQFVANPGGVLEDLPVIVLINGGSASASEIISGAIQDLDRGLVVGETSFGKGLVQQVFGLNDGSAIKFTTAKYFTPSGRSIQRPFADKKKYLAMEGRNNQLAEGANFDHQGEADSTRPVFKTISGRKVLGGGGIVPDYIIKSDTVGRFYDSLARKYVFFEANEKFIMRYGNDIRAKYGRDFRSYWLNYSITDEHLQLYKDVAKEKGLEWREADFQKEKVMITNAMKALAASYIWNWDGANAFLYALLQPKQLEKALKLFPESIKIAKAK